MTRGSAIVRAMIFAGTPLLGILAAHSLHYLLLVPDAAHRGALLEKTGHGYLPRAVAVAVAWSALAALATAARGFGRGRRGETVRSGLAATIARLTALQAAGFLLVEVVERMASGSPLAELPPMLLLGGFALQAAVATVAAFVHALIERTGERLGRAIGRVPAHPRVAVRTPTPATIRRARANLFAHDLTRRGPPALHALRV